MGTDKIDLTYFFTNLGDRAILVEDLAILQFTLNAHSLYNPTPEQSISARAKLITQ